MEQAEIIEQQKEISANFLTKQQNAFRLISDTDIFLQEENFDKATENYRKAIGILTEIGWTHGYLKLLQETLQTINERKRESEKDKQLEQELLIKKQKEGEEFQAKISTSIQREKDRIKRKEFEIQRREELIEKTENRKQEAFKLMDNAENSLNQNQYLQSIEKYRQAELILNEIGFSTRAIREMIQRVKQKGIGDREVKFEDKTEASTKSPKWFPDVKIEDLRTD